MKGQIALICPHCTGSETVRIIPRETADAQTTVEYGCLECAGTFKRENYTEAGEWRPDITITAEGTK